jgi:hypothetical protein
MNPHEQPEQISELDAFKKELEPIFDERFYTLGHGASIQVAESILEKGLLAKTPAVDTTAYPLENAEKGIDLILNWPHHAAQAIIVLMFPKDVETSRGGISRDEHLWEEHTADALNPYKLPPKYIKGYIDVHNKKFVANPAFEENPTMPEPTMRSHRGPESRIESNQGPIEIPRPSETDSPEATDIW